MTNHFCALVEQTKSRAKRSVFLLLPQGMRVQRVDFLIQTASPHKYANGILINLCVSYKIVNGLTAIYGSDHLSLSSSLRINPYTGRDLKLNTAYFISKLTIGIARLILLLVPLTFMPLRSGSLLLTR